MRLLLAFSATTAWAALLGCQARPPEPPPATATTIDSTLPRDEAIRRFRAGLDSVAELSEGASSRDELIRRFVAAIETADTAELRRLALTKEEFAWIYYPTNPQGLPPYDLAPDLMWFMVETRGRTGLAKALQERGGKPLGYVRSDCDPKPSLEGENVVWGPCTIVRRQDKGDELVERLFGPIIERHGRFKFVNYANKID